MCRCAFRKRSGLLTSILAIPRRSIGILSDPQRTKIRAVHRVENVMPDRDKNSRRHSRENGNKCRSPHCLRRKNIRLTRLSVNRILVSLPRRLLKQHQLPAPSAPKRENAFVFHRSIRRQSDSSVLPSTLRLPYRLTLQWLAADVACAVPSAFVSSFSAEDSGR